MSVDPDLHADLGLALRATRAAAAEVLPFFGRDLEVRYKSPDQPLTEADLRADAVLRKLLIGERPGYGWLSEETIDSPDRLGRDRVWIVDPIDGTHAFIQGRPEYVISVALAVHAEIELGVVFNPSTDELYQAVRRHGSFLNGERLRTSVDTRSLLVSRSDLRGRAFDALSDEWELTPLGSTAYKMVKVAEGTGAGYVSRGPKSEWDVAAADLIIEEAGGVATDAAGGELRYNRPVPFLRGLIAAAREAHPELVRRIGSLSDPTSEPKTKE